MTDKEILDELRADLQKSGGDTSRTSPKLGDLAWHWSGSDSSVIEHIFPDGNGKLMIEARRKDGGWFRASAKVFVWISREEYAAKRLLVKA